ncbi:MAG: HD domain-containing protein [Halanaerobiales bacterium]|nr:HD domain-containing protein [Halanaerobiales bacterium]
MSDNLELVYELMQLLEKKEYENVLKTLCSFLNVEHAYLINYYDKANKADIIVSWNVSDEVIKQLKEFKINEFEDIKHELTKGEIICMDSDNLSNKSCLPIRNLLNQYEKQSIMLVPIRSSKKELIGILGLADSRKKEWSKKCKRILEIVTYNLKYSWEDEILNLKYQSIIENSNSAIVILNKEGNIIELNDKFESLANSSKTTLKNEKWFFDFIAEKDKEKMIERHNCRRKGQDVISDYRFTFVDSNHKKREAKIKVKIIPGTDKSACSIEDITDKKRTENLIQLQEEKLSESYKQLKKSRDQLESTYLDLIDKNIENEKLINNIEKLIDLMSSLNISSGNNLDNFLSDLLYTVLEIVEVADYGSVFVFNDHDRVEYVETVGHDLAKLNELEIEGSAYKHENEKVKIVNDILNQNKMKMDRKQAVKIQEASLPVKQSIPVILKEKNNIFGGICIDIAAGSENEFKRDDVRLITSFKNLANTFFKLDRYKRLNSQFNKELVNSLLNFLSQYDVYTNNHSKNVARLGRKIAKNMGLHEEIQNDIYWTGMLHDMGKLIVPANILNKNDSLTDKEYEIIKNHPVHCYEALNNTEFLKDIGRYVLYHHERWDGKGYPSGIKKEEIPLVSRIIAVADAWDAMRSKRAYRDPLSRKEAKEEILKNKGKQFDPKIAEKLLEII